MRYLVDTSVLKRLHRPAIREVVQPLAVAGQLGRARISDLEVGYSARNSDEWDRLIEALDTFELVETTAAQVRRALQVQRLLAERSQRVSFRQAGDMGTCPKVWVLDLRVIRLIRKRVA